MTLFEQWQSYEAEVVPKGAPLVQREVCRCAFYAGAASLFQLVLSFGIVASDDECELNMQRLHDELKAFPRVGSC